MIVRSLVALSLVVCLVATGCKSGESMAGKYRIEQEGAGLGEGAEKFELDLREDGTFDIGVAQLKLASGTWKADGKNLTLSSATGSLGTSYREEGGKLIPVIGGKDVTFWRFVPKG